jgi:hypothetical protein
VQDQKNYSLLNPILFAVLKLFWLSSLQCRIKRSIDCPLPFSFDRTALDEAVALLGNKDKTVDDIQTEDGEAE